VSGCAIAMLPDMARLCVPLDVECMPPTGALSSDASESFRSRRCSCLIFSLHDFGLHSFVGGA
jgi:hypothetical protein